MTPALTKRRGRPSLNFAQFLDRARATHGHRYDYSRVNYTTNAAKVTITCPVHGAFEQKPSNHFLGRGCKACADSSLRNTQEEFIAAARRAHGHRYDYSRACYKGNKTKVTIICPVHGAFEQLPNDHTSGLGCETCRVAAKTKTQDQFLKEARAVHKNFYGYTKARYTNSYTKVIIICPVHGEFEQEAKGHLEGKGCLACAREVEHFWNAHGWAARQRGRAAVLYVLRMSGHGETFYKAGITFDFARRFSVKPPYQIEVLALFVSDDALAIWEAEAAIKKAFKSLKYRPQKRFGGWQECYTSPGEILVLLASKPALTQQKSPVELTGLFCRTTPKIKAFSSARSEIGF